jgi:hypothetical protein
MVFGWVHSNFIQSGSPQNSDPAIQGIPRNGAGGRPFRPPRGGTGGWSAQGPYLPSSVRVIYFNIYLTCFTVPLGEHPLGRQRIASNMLPDHHRIDPLLFSTFGTLKTAALNLHTPKRVIRL